MPISDVNTEYISDTHPLNILVGAVVILGRFEWLTTSHETVGSFQSGLAK